MGFKNLLIRIFTSLFLVFLSLTNFPISDMFSISEDYGCVFSIISLHVTKLFITIFDN